MNKELIIGNCFKINADILFTYNNSIYPKFIANIIKNYYRKKLIRSINKLYKANKPLDAYNLYDFFLYLNNNYRDESYGNITKTEYFDNIDIIKAYLDFDIYKCIFKVKNDDNFVELRYSKKENNKPIKTYIVELDQLSSTKNDISKDIENINKILLTNIANYILETINSYN